MVIKAVKTTLVYGSSELTINFDFSVGHHSFKNQLNLFISPGFICFKMIAIQPLLIRFFLVMAIIITTKSLQFPLRWYRYFGPFTAIHSLGTKEFPLNSMVFIRS